ncbi:site-specific DNA-methyltransferase [Vibrio alginolyticus]|uniref:site-specific DNA-methyltransferase n=1 Tax=Vibrio alginolyticus TaxID=663 RepID=UPI0038CDAD74
MSKYNELVKKLKEIFQIDRPELDFGIYRILNARADEINDYLDNKLKAKIQSALADAGDANKADLEQQLQAAIKAATDAGFEPDQSPKVQDLKGQLKSAASGASEHENAVFSHLLTFFSRYYDSGDFISKRRYKGDTYAIPYAGEEVMLHWANKDQYYIKSGENFANYSFKLDDGRKVNFKLLAADTAKDNRKDNDADRRFVLIEPHIRTKLDEDGEEFEQAYQPVEVIKTTDLVDGESVETEELVIHFEYKAMKKGTKQEALVQTAASSILSDQLVQQDWADLTKRAPTEKNPNRTELERHLVTYTQRNTADYFIHKDLGGFLTYELDFYIKNEVMHLDNVQNAEVFANIEKQLRMIQCLRSVAQELITFLTQIENFQKKLWTKKKFVTKSHYVISLDRISFEHYDDIAGVDKQWEQWKKLNFIESLENKSSEYLKAKGGLLVDTSLLPECLAEKIINEIDYLDEETSGLLIHSDNYQALNLLRNKYNSKVKAMYIDPPYNTDAAPILYKNGYRDSSWLTLLNDRLDKAYPLLENSGVLCATIDDYEHNEFAKIIKQKFGAENSLGTVTVRMNPSGRITANGLAQSHEYAIFSGKSSQSKLLKMERSEEQNSRFNNVDDAGVYELRNFRREGSSSDRSERPKRHFPIYVDADTFRIPSMKWDESTRSYIDIEMPHENEQVVWPVDATGRERVWRWGIERINREHSEIFPKVNNKGVLNIYYKYRPNNEGITPPSVWVDKKYSATEYGTNTLKQIFGNQNIFDFPKSIHAVEDCVDISGARDKGSICLDFFAGSGTTGHAVINLNRKDDGKRKFVLIEQGEYFNTITLPRLMKVSFSNEWKSGAPKNDNHHSVIFKVMKLESYEDSLNNINLISKNAGLFESLPHEIADEYLLKYMLAEESKGSFLNTDSFRKPFSYEMDIATDSAGATERKAIDLVETFNYLIGLHVKSIESNIERGFVRLEGTLPTGERTLILWRDCDKIGYDKLNDYANRFDLYAKEQTFDVIYINGDHNLQTAFTVEGEDGEIVRSLKLRQIEPEFLSLMFAEEA